MPPAGYPAFLQYLQSGRVSNFSALDSLHLAGAAEHGCTRFLSNDAQLKRFPDVLVEILVSLVPDGAIDAAEFGGSHTSGFLWKADSPRFVDDGRAHQFRGHQT